MADISSFISLIKKAVYGEDVRDAISNALTRMNTESSGAVSTANSAVTTANAAKTSAQQAASSAAAAVKLVDDNMAGYVLRCQEIAQHTADAAGSINVSILQAQYAARDAEAARNSIMNQSGVYDVISIDTTNVIKGKCVSKTGALINNEIYSVTKPFTVKANHIIAPTVVCQSDVCVIAKYNSNGTYTPLVTGQGIGSYSYKTTTDGQYVVSFEWTEAEVDPVYGSIKVAYAMFEALPAIDNKIHALENADVSINNEIQNLKNADVSINNEIQNLKNADVSINTKIQELVNEDVSIHAYISSLEDEDVEINNRITELKNGSVYDNTKSIRKLGGEFNTLFGNNIKSQNLSVDSSIFGLSTDSVETNIDLIGGRTIELNNIAKKFTDFRIIKAERVYDISEDYVTIFNKVDSGTTVVLDKGFDYIYNHVYYISADVLKTGRGNPVVSITLGKNQVSLRPTTDITHHISFISNAVGASGTDVSNLICGLGMAGDIWANETHVTFSNLTVYDLTEMFGSNKVTEYGWADNPELVPDYLKPYRGRGVTRIDLKLKSLFLRGARFNGYLFSGSNFITDQLATTEPIFLNVGYYTAALYFVSTKERCEASEWRVLRVDKDSTSTDTTGIAEIANASNDNNITFHISTAGYYKVIVAAKPASQLYGYDMVIEAGETSTGYIEHHNILSTINISNDILNLDGYGKSYGDYYNYVDFVKGEYHQLVDDNGLLEKEIVTSLSNYQDGFHINTTGKVRMAFGFDNPEFDNWFYVPLDLYSKEVVNVSQSDFIQYLETGEGNGDFFVKASYLKILYDKLLSVLQ